MALICQKFQLTMSRQIYILQDIPSPDIENINQASLRVAIGGDSLQWKKMEV